MQDLVATNIRLPREKLKALKLKAVEEGKSVSQLIREAIELILPPQKTLTEEEFKNDPFFKIIGVCESGIKDGSVNHDKYIYGEDV
jgi:hypothetical protein